MINGVVEIKNLGRECFSGTIHITAKNTEHFNAIMLNEFKKHLMSSDIAFDNGKIFAGSRTVGEYIIVAKEVESEIN